MNVPIHVLFIENNPDDARLVKEELRSVNSKTVILLEWANTLEAGLERLGRNNFEAVLLDLNLPDSAGIEPLEHILAHAPDMPVIVIMDETDEETGIEAIQAGAQDYLAKGQMDGHLLARSIHYAIQRKQTDGQLADALEFTERILTSSPVGILTYKLTGECMSANTHAAQMVGTTVEKLKGQNFWELESWKKSGLYELAEEAIMTGKLSAGDIHIITTFNKEAWFRAQFVTFKSGGEELLLLTIGDITERKRTEEALRESEENYRQLFEAESDAIFLIENETGRILQANQAACVLYGYSQEELLSKKNVDLSAEPEQTRHVTQETPTIVEQVITIPLRFHRKQDGTVFPVEITGRFFVHQDRPVHIAAIRDITERKRAEEALRASEERFRSYFELGLIGMAITSPGKGFIEVNGRICEILGYERAELMKIPWDTITQPDDIAADVAQFNRLLAGKINGYSLEKRFIHKNGRIVHTSISVNAIRSSDGSVNYLVALMEDITERKQAENALQESELRYRTLVNQIPAIVYTATKGQTQFVSSQIERMLGYTPEEWIKGGIEIWESSIHPDDRARVLDEYQRCARTGQGLDCEYRLIAKNGNPVWVRDQSTILRNHEDRPLVTHGIVYDMTQSKQVEAEIKRRLAELEAISRISTVLRAAESLEEMLSQVLDETLAVIETEAGTIKLYDSVSESLVSVVSRGWYKEIEDVVIRPGEGTSGTVFSTGAPYLAREFVTDPITIDSARPRIPSGWGGACVPIRSGQIITGVLFVAVALPRELSQADLNLLNTLAEMAGSAIHRMQLYEETLQQLDRLNALQEIDRAISSSFDLRLTLEIVINQVIRLLKADAADILLIPPEAFRLEFASGKGFQTSGIKSTRLGLGEGMPGPVARELRTVQIENLSDVKDKFVRRDLLAGENFVSYLGVPLVVKGKIKGVLEIFHRSALKPEPGWVKFLETLAGQAAIAIDNSQLFQDVQRSNSELVVAYDATIEGWVSALDLRYKEAKGHSERVTHMTLQLARRMGIREEKLIHIRRGALLHDIGKMVVPDHVLMNTGELSTDHQELIRLHPQYAYDILSPIQYLKDALEIPYCHHERWNGTGYPRGLKGGQIPLAARIFAVIDVWDSLTSDRPYRAAWSKSKARKYIIEHSGIYFDPEVVEMFLQMVPDTSTESTANL